jgi:hypothetical protein
MRRLLWVAAVLVFLAGVQLFVFPQRTGRYFAWTIDPPLTAAFLGASYWSSVAFEVSAARARTWALARIAVPTVFVFTTLTLLVTLIHLDRFHLGGEFEGTTQAVTWAWIGIYVVVPVLMAWLWLAQARLPGRDPRRERPLPPWLAGVVLVQAVVLVALGVYLLVDPTGAADLWPWKLTPLTGRAIGAWLASLGLAAAHALVERDVRRLRPAAVAYLTFGLLQAVALLRYPHTPDWDDVRSYLYLTFLVSAVVVGASTLSLSRSGVASAGGRSGQPTAVA